MRCLIFVAWISCCWLCHKGHGRRMTLLEDVLLQDFMMVHSGSSRCNHDDVRKSNNWKNVSFVFGSSKTNMMSHFWSDVNREKEKYTFLAEIQFDNNDYNWTIRIGKGGNIYSWTFLDHDGKIKEVIPPQTNPKSPWVDEVIQTVAVNLNQNSNIHPYFVHQAGIYEIDDDDDLLRLPFYSPNIATSCNSHQCIFATWAQQAHVPTIHKSHLLILTRYRLCSPTVLEYSTVLYNMPPTDTTLKKDVDDTLNYFNVPWGGVRTSTFPEVLLSEQIHSPNNNISRSIMKDPQVPLQQFRDTTTAHSIPNLSEMGGFTTFAQSFTNRSITIDMPCAIPSTQTWKTSCSNDDHDGYVRLQLIVQANNTCEYLETSSKNQGGIYVVQLKTHSIHHEKFPNMVGCRAHCYPHLPNGVMKFVNRRSGDYIVVPDIVWWLRNGQYTYFHSPYATDKQINQIFFQGDIIDVIMESAINTTFDTAMALSYVHGMGKEDHDNDSHWNWMPTRARFGLAHRDFTVFTVNARVNLAPGHALINRQYMILDKLSNIPSIANDWIDETFMDLVDITSIGRPLFLYLSLWNASFSIDISNTTSCEHEMKLLCTGFSTPNSSSPSLLPYFYITCGNDTYVGPNLYHFSPNTTIQRSYVCGNIATSTHHNHIRPKWKLLGYFSSSSCPTLHNVIYESDLCTIAVTDNVRETSSDPSFASPTMHSAISSSQQRSSAQFKTPQTNEISNCQSINTENDKICTKKNTSLWNYLKQHNHRTYLFGSSLINTWRL